MVLKSKFPGTCSACSCRFPSGTEIEWSKSSGARHLTATQCFEAKQSKVAASAVVVPKVDLSSIVQFLKAAQQRGLKRPKLRVLAPDGRSELRLSLTVAGKAPGTLSVVLSDNFIGGVRPDGTPFGTVASDDVLQLHLLKVASDPISAAREYAALMCSCSFCGKPLTDAGSVEVGYGPVCARHWGLPHHPVGTTVLRSVPSEVEPWPGSGTTAPS